MANVNRRKRKCPERICADDKHGTSGPHSGRHGEGAGNPGGDGETHSPPREHHRKRAGRQAQYRRGHIAEDSRGAEVQPEIVGVIFNLRCYLLQKGESWEGRLETRYMTYSGSGAVPPKTIR